MKLLPAKRDKLEKLETEPPKQPKQPKRPRRPKPLSSWKLSVASWRELRRNWRPYIIIMAILVIPLDILSMLAGPSNDIFNTLSIVAIVIMNVALLWAIVEHERTGTVPGRGAAYYEGSIVLVRYLVVLLLTILLFIPAIIGLVIYVNGVAVVEVTGTLAEQMVIGIVSLIISLPSIVLVTRFSLALPAVVASGLRPIAAMRFSRQLTLGRFWKVLGRNLGLLILLLAAGLPIAAITYGLNWLKIPVVPGLFFLLATTFITVPLYNIYQLWLYRSLEQS